MFTGGRITGEYKRPDAIWVPRRAFPMQPGNYAYGQWGGIM